jgi:hypothetical protein
MKRSGFFTALFTATILLSGSLQAQLKSDAGYQSITEAELRNHIFFLASDYMNGRVSTTPEYAVAAQYVAAQFAAVGVEPFVANANGKLDYMQGLPFARTILNDKLLWTITRKGTVTKLVHQSDFKVLTGNQLNYDNVGLVYVGYGIDEPKQSWEDLKGLDIKGKIAICLTGAPIRDGKPVLSQAAHDKYTGRRGHFSKAMVLMTLHGAVGVIMVDPDGTSGLVYDETNSAFTTNKTSYLGATRNNRSMSRPTIYLAKPEFLNLVMDGRKNNPIKADNILKNYKTEQLSDIYLHSQIETLKEDTLYSNNVIGIVPGTDSLLKHEYIVVGGHLDHVGPQKGLPCNGADDNASGSAGVMELAGAIAQNPCKRTVVFAAWSGEEMGLLGSAFFIESGLIAKDKIKFNLNMDMIGRTGKGNESTRAHYVVTDKKYVKELTAYIDGLNTGVTNFPILYNDDENSPGGSDHMSFIQAGIPAFFFFSGVHADLHNPGDDPEKIDYPKAASICRLGYLIVQKLGNSAIVPTFE